MKCIVDRIVKKALEQIEGPPKKNTLTDVQQRVQDVFQKYDFGCHNEGVASMMEALTGHKPVKIGTTDAKLFTVGTSLQGVRIMVLGITGGTLYGMSVDHPATQGYYTCTDSQMSPTSKAVKKNIIAAFQKFSDADVLDFMTTKLAGAYPGVMLRALD